MSFKSKDIVRFIEEYAPLHLAEDWDNVGLMIGDLDSDIERVLLCLDVTETVVDEAISTNANMIISHHPLIFSGIKSINTEGGKGKIIKKLIKNDISVYSAHTNMDFTEEGVNYSLAKQLKLSEITNLREYKTAVPAGKLDIEGIEYGLGKVGHLEKEKTLEEFISHVKKQLNISVLRVIGSAKHAVSKVGVFCGSFDGDYSGIIKEKTDILVTGDIKHHTALDINELGLCVIDAGHYATERIILPVLSEKLKQRFIDLEVTISADESDPIKFY